MTVRISREPMIRLLIDGFPLMRINIETNAINIGKSKVATAKKYTDCEISDPFIPIVSARSANVEWVPMGDDPSMFTI